MKPRIHLVTLGVSDLERSKRFYRDVLGFPMSGAFEGADIAFFNLGGAVLGLYPRHLLAKDAGLSESGPQPEASGGGFGGITLAHDVPNREDVDATLAALQKAGAKIIRPAHDAEWGGRSGYFADPDGYPWEVGWNPGFPFAEDGSVIIPP